MRTPFDRLTPLAIVRASRIMAGLVTILLMAGYVTDSMTPSSAGVGAFTMAALLLLSAPGQRATEMLGAIAVWMSFAEFLATISSGHFMLWRWAVAVATLGGLIAVINIQYLRLLARVAPDTPMGDLDRRTIPSLGAVPMSPSALATARRDEEPLRAE